jgi:hypothetical protein
MIKSAGSAFDWLFRSRVTGRIVVAQLPNLPLAVWIGASLLRWALRPNGHSSTWLSVVAAAALLVWAGDEVARGVNPWRRGLGGAVLVALIIRWAAPGWLSL